MMTMRICFTPVKQSNGDCLKEAAPQVESRLQLSRIFCDERTEEEELRILVVGCPAMMKEEEVNIAIAFPIFGNRNENEKNIPHFQEQE